jgi:hypothetical protein
MLAMVFGRGKVESAEFVVWLPGKLHSNYGQRDLPCVSQPTINFATFSRTLHDSSLVRSGSNIVVFRR